MWELGQQHPSRSKFPNVYEEMMKPGFLDEREAKLLIYKLMRSNPTWAAELLMGVKLFPFQHIAIKTIFESDYIMNIWGRGLSKTWSAAVTASLDAILHQGIEIGIISKSFRQSRQIFAKIEDIAASPKAALFNQCLTRIRKNNDEWIAEIGRSRIRALPLGDGDKLRGYRFSRMYIDEMLIMPEKIVNEVILPFLSVVTNPVERQEIYDLETELIKQGKMKPSERVRWPNNKIIMLSSASYKFEYLYKLYEKYERLIKVGGEDEEEEGTRAILHFSYEISPEKLYDRNLVSQAKETMSQAQFEREFKSKFTDDSDGYFKMSKMEACTIKDGEGQCVETTGVPGAKYILAFDPSWAESESSDFFSIGILKLDEENQKATLVHQYAVAGRRLKDHMNYLLYLWEHFNIVAIIGDYYGGGQFMSAVNESSVFQNKKIKFNMIDANFDDPTEYAKALRDFKRQHNKQTLTICHLRRPSSIWIRSANELLQANIDHKRILFAGAAIEDSFKVQVEKEFPVENLKFMSPYEEGAEKLSAAAKKIDFVEILKTRIEATKVQCSMIEITTSPLGVQTFDLPKELKKQQGQTRARKDSYSCLLLGNWMAKVWFDMHKKDVEDYGDTFTPMCLSDGSSI